MIEARMAIEVDERFGDIDNQGIHVGLNSA